MYKKLRISVLSVLYRLPLTKKWAYKRLPRHQSGYKHYWVDDKAYVGSLKDKQNALSLLASNPTTEYLRERIDAFAAKTVLDVGCGWGRQLYTLAPFYQIAGCDVAVEYVHEVQSRGFSAFQLDLVTASQDWLEQHKNGWEVSYAILVFSFFIDRPDEMRRAMRSLEVITAKKILIWDWHHICDYMRSIYPSDKFEYHYIPVSG